MKLETMQENTTTIEIPQSNGRSIYTQLITVRNTNILLNCGSLEECVGVDPKSIDILLLSHLKMEFIGGLALFRRNGFVGKVFATFPIKTIGKLMLMEEIKHNVVFKNNLNFSTEEIENYFDEIIGVKYLQPVDIGNGITAVAHNSGYTLGGSVWVVRTETDNFVFLFKINHKKTNHLNGIDLSVIPKNSIVVADTCYVKQKPVNRIDKNQGVFLLLNKYINIDSKVLILIDYYNFLELGLILDSYLKQKNLKAACLGFMARKFAETAKTMVEWSGENVNRVFLEEKENPFAFKNITFYSSFSNVEKSSVYIVFEDFGFFNKVLDEINASENLVLNLKNKKLDQNICIYNVPEFILERKKVSEKKTKTENENKKESVEINKPWYEIYTDIWVDNTVKYFPHVKKRRLFDEYNDFLTLENFSKMADNKIEEIDGNEREKDEDDIYEEKEVINIISTQIDVECEIINLDFDEICDFNSSINVFDFINPKKLILLSRDDDEMFFFLRCKMHRNFMDVALMQDRITIFPDKCQRVPLDNQFIEQSLVTISNNKYMGFKGKYVDGVIKYFGPTSKKFTVGAISFSVLKKSIVDCNYEVEIQNNVMIVEKKIKIIHENDKYLMEGEHGDLYYTIRSIVYKFISYL